MESDPQGSRGSHRPVSCQSLGLLQVDEKLSTVIVVSRTRLGQRKPPCRAVEKREPQVGLQRRDRLAQDGWRHIENMGGGRKGLRLDDTAKKFECSQLVHGSAQGGLSQFIILRNLAHIKCQNQDRSGVRPGVRTVAATLRGELGLLSAKSGRDSFAEVEP